MVCVIIIIFIHIDLRITMLSVGVLIKDAIFMHYIYFVSIMHNINTENNNAKNFVLSKGVGNINAQTK